ncbi:IS256 family transposase, partial [Bifidobacterium pseudocatenulatum]|nr:IS256 family transposase [Bifidobacterium pseudocatenulatum]
NRREGGVNSDVKNVLRNHRGRSEEHMLRAGEWGCYMKTAHPRPEAFIPNDPLEDGKATAPEPEGDVSPAYGIGV